MKTTTVKPEAPKWLVIDAAGVTHGRIATKAAHLLRGKQKPTFSPHQLCGDHVVVINAAKIEVHPGKIRKGVFAKHSGYIGHLTTIPLKDILKDKPSQLIERAVAGMLPKNKLRPLMLKRLHIFEDEAHTFEAQKPTPVTLP